MKRYRVIGADFDSRAGFLSMPIRDTWEPEVQKRHLDNKIQDLAGLVNEYGGADSQVKLRNFLELGNLPLSIWSYHNLFLRQIRDAFVMGAYYPALTGACALGERILNHLVLELRDYYRSTPQYKRVYDSDSFQDWDEATDILLSWGVLLPEVGESFKHLATIRHRKAIHFNPELTDDDRSPSLEAIKTLTDIIARQFSAFFGPPPWIIPNTPGAAFIRKEAEELPFIREFYLPNCRLVGPYHKVDVSVEGRGVVFHIEDDYNYEDREVSDEEFAELIQQGPPE